MSRRGLTATGVLMSALALAQSSCGSGNSDGDGARGGASGAAAGGDSGSQSGGQGGTPTDGGSGGTSTGGAASGGSDTGGVASGGAAGTATTGGASGGGASKGGANSGGSGGSTSDRGGGGGGGSGGSGGSAGGASGSGGKGGGGPLPPELTFTLEPGSDALGGIEAMWGSGPDDIYAVGRLGTLLHYKDQKWGLEDAATSATLTGVWGSGADDVYVSVNANVVLHSKGDGTWTRETFDAGYTFTTVWGTGKNDVYASAGVLFHKDATGTWTQQPDVGNANALWGSSASDLYAALNYGNSPTIYHSTGDGKWHSQTSPMVSLRDLSGSAADRIYAAGGRSVFSSSGNGTWTAELTNDADVLNAVFAQSGDAVFACGQLGSFYRSNGAGTWSSAVPIAAAGLGSTSVCFAVWATAPDNVYVGTLKGVYRGTPK